MELFNENGIATPKGIVAFSAEEAEAGYKSLGNRKFILMWACIYFGLLWFIEKFKVCLFNTIPVLGRNFN